MREKIHVRVSVALPVAPEHIYDAWLDTASVRSWLKIALIDMGLSGDVAQVKIDPKVGGEFLFSDRRDGVETSHWGNYLQLDRPTTIAFTWIINQDDQDDPSKVILELSAQDDGSCQALLTHEMDAAWSEYISQTEQAWTKMLIASSQV